MVLKRLLSKNLLVELVWIVIASGIALALSYILTTYFSSIGEFNSHDTYFVVNETSSVFSYFGYIFFPLLFLIYGIKEAFRKYKSIPANIITIIACTGLIICQTQLFMVIGTVSAFYHFTNPSGSSQNGWTVYPPLSTNEVYMSNENPLTIDAIYSILQYAFLPVVIAMLIFVSIKTGRLMAQNKQ